MNIYIYERNCINSPLLYIHEYHNLHKVLTLPWEVWFNIRASRRTGRTGTARSGLPGLEEAQATRGSKTSTDRLTVLRHAGQAARQAQESVDFEGLKK